MDPLDLLPARFCSLVYYWAVRNADEDGKTKFDRRLWMPPKGVAPPPGSPWSPEAETAAFGSLAAQVGARAVKQGSDVGAAT